MIHLLVYRTRLIEISFTLSPVQISQLSTVISLQPICISYKILFEPLLNPLHSKSDGRSESWKRGRILLEHLSNGTHEIVIYKLTKRGKLVKALFQKADLNDKKYVRYLLSLIDGYVRC